MLYFSELKNKGVYTEDGVHVGKLQDVIFLASDNPTITKIVIAATSGHKMRFVVPVEFVNKINSVIALRKEYKLADLAENELFVEKNLLDKQIIDIKGSKVVRVNDVVIQSKPYYYIAGVDISWWGILRWLGVEDKFISLYKRLHIQLKQQFLSWAEIQPLELARGRVQLKSEQEKLEKIRPEDLADYLERTTTKNITKILNVLDERFAAEVIGNLNINYQNALFRNFSDSKAAKVISLIDPDEAVDILLTLSPKKREQIIYLLGHDRKKELQYLLRLAKTPIGDFITSQYLTVSPQDSVRKVLEIIRRETSDFSFLYYIYVINDEDQLMGVVNLHELLLQQSDTPIYKFMIQNVVVIHLTTPEEIALNKMLKYKLQALPVTDNEKKLLGIVTHDDLTELMLEKL